MSNKLSNPAKEISLKIRQLKTALKSKKLTDEQRKTFQGNIESLKSLREKLSNQRFDSLLNEIQTILTK